MEIGTVRPVDIEQEMRESYLDYAMSVIVARALPDARDGLKPVHRRILWAMHQIGLRHSGEHKKSAKIVGEVLGKYHPHGDLAVYDALVRLAQDFNMRYPLVDGQGNFGSVDGDSPAAMRYTEVRLSAIAEEMLADIDKDTVDFIPNFDGSEKEPTVLPARLPNLLLMGASGIAVGMATNIPPHNLNEIADGLIYIVDRFDKAADITPDDLAKHIPGPDFPTGGFIVGADGIRQAYATGKGIIVLRAKAHIEEMRGNRHQMVVTELPYQVNKATLIERIAELVRDKRIEDISDLRDESDRRGMSIVIELKRGAQPQVVLNQLLKFTAMQTTFGVNMLALVEGEPRVLTLKSILLHYITHRQVVVTRRTEFLLARAKERAHILEGLRIALKNLDAVIATIRKAKSAEDAQKDLIAKFKLTPVQAQAILDMQLRRLAALERQKVEDEFKEVTALIKELFDLLAHPQKILGVIKSELQELKKRYGDNRRTVILPEAEAEIDIEATIPEEDVLVAITQRGYIKRVAVDTYRAQKRGGRGVTGMATREEDAVEHLFLANTKDDVLFFTNQGRVFQEKAYQIPDASRQARGLPVNNLLALAPREMVTAAFAVSSFDQGKYLVLATRQGKVKRTPISEFKNIRSSGIIAMGLEKRDELGWVKLTKGHEDLILITSRGQAIRFSESEVRPMGRTAGGVMGIALQPGDQVAGLEVVDAKGYLLVVTEKGFGKKTLLGSGREKDTSKIYPRQKRHGLGIRTISRAAMEETGKIVAAQVVHPEDELTVISTEGMVLRTPLAQISSLGRDTRGVKVMDLRPGDSVASLARIHSPQNKDGRR